MISLFSLKDLNKKAAVIDEDKLLWLNKQHFRRKLTDPDHLEKLVKQLQVYVEKSYSDVLSVTDFRRSVGYLQKVLLLLEVCSHHSANCHTVRHEHTCTLTHIHTHTHTHTHTQHTQTGPS